MPPPAPPCRLWPYLLAHAAAAAWIDLGHLHRLQSCDSVVFVLASLYEWTPFFWEQDRVGLLLPLLASGVRDPFANLLVQTGVLTFAGLSVPLLLARYVCPHPMAPAAVTLGNAAFVLAAPDLLHENMLVVCYYPLALALGVGGLVVLDARGGGPAGVVGRGVVGVGMVAAAHWVYMAVCLVLVPLIAVRALVGPRDDRGGAVGRAAAGLVGVGLGLAAVSWLMAHVRATSDPPLTSTPAVGSPVEMWPENWASFARQVGDLPGFWDWAALVGVPAAAGLGLGLALDRRAVGRAAVRSLPLLAAAAAEVGVLGTREWPAWNNHHPRYVLAAVTVGWVVLAAVGVAPVLGRWGRGPRAAVVGAAAVGLLFAAATARYGWPSAAGVRADLDHQFGEVTETLIADGAEAWGGEYMNTWPLVLHVNMVLHERRAGREVVGVTFRSQPWRHRWESGPLRDGFRVFAPADQEQVARWWIAQHGLESAGPPTYRGRLVVIPVRPTAPRAG